MSITCQLHFDLENLNRTVDFLVAKNGYSRAQESNPIHLVFKQLVNASKKVVEQTPLQQLVSEARTCVFYKVDKQTGVGFLLEIIATADENRVMAAPGLKVTLPHGDRVLVEQVAVDSVDKSGIVFLTHFFVRVGSELAISRATDFE